MPINPTTLKALIDTQITNETVDFAITPAEVGGRMKDTIDYTTEQIAGISSTPDATTSVKGKIKLAGDLAGTADLPTVPALADKEILVNKSTNVTTDGASDTKYPSVKAVKTYVDANVGGTQDLQQTVDLGDTVTDGFSKTKLEAGQITVENTFSLKDTKILSDRITMTNSNGGLKTLNIVAPSDISQNRIITFPNNSGTVELTSNKSSNVALGTSDILYPTQNAVKTYVDANVGAIPTFQEITDNGGNIITDAFGTQTFNANTNVFNNIADGKFGIYALGSFNISDGTNSQNVELPTTLTGGVKTITFPNSTGIVALKTYKIWRAVINYNSVVRVLIDEIGFTSPTITNPFNGVVYVTKAGFFTSLDPNKLEFLSTNLNNSGQVFVTLADQGGGVTPNNQFQVNIYDMTGGQTGTPNGNVTVEIRIYA